VYVFVAATERSGPACSGKTTRAAAARGESVSFVIAIVGRCCRFASSITARMSGDCPDCEIPTTAAPAKRGGFPYGPNRLGAARATGSRLHAPQAYCA
jgi:hypothetical protein